MSRTVQVDNRSGLPEHPGDQLPEEITHAPSEAAVARIAAAALEAMEATGELSISLVTDEEIAGINAQWRNKPVATNVLSFPMEDDDLVGDVVLSLETVARQGAETGAGYAYTFAFYLVHGILHCLGWTHDRADDEAAMRAKTEEIVAAAGI